VTSPGTGEAARRRALGRAGETAAADFLRRRGFDVVARNYHTPHGLDLVVAREGTVIFVEVKTGGEAATVDPRTQFTPRKVARLYRAALDYWERERPGEEPDLRFDFVVVVRRGEGFAVEHYEAVALADYLPADFEW
jgi:putative endonuclease